jgi:PAS domain S-box-containing protein
MTPLPNSTLTILAIGEERPDLTTAVELLRRDGYQLIAAFTEVDGRCAFQSTPPDIVLLGPLPAGQDQATLLAFLRASSDSDDLFVLGLAPPDEADGLLELFDDVIELPVTPAKVRRRVETAVRLAEAKSQAQATERHFLELTNALQSGEERYRQMFETNQAVKLIVNPQTGQIVDANQAACDFYGYPREALITLQIAAINTLPPEQIDIEMRNALAQRRRFFNFQHRLASGEIRDVEVYSGPVGSSGQTLLYSIVQDVTDRKEIERALRMKEAALHSAVNALILADLAGRILYVNQAFLDLWGFETESEVLGRDSLTEWGGEAVVSKLARALQSEGSWIGDWSGWRLDGRFLFIEMMANVVRDPQGEPICFLASMIDATERRQAEIALRERESLLRQQLELSLALKEPLTLAETLDISLTAVLNISGMDTAVLHLDSHNGSQVYYKARLPEFEQIAQQQSAQDFTPIQRDLERGPLYLHHQAVNGDSLPIPQGESAVRSMAQIPLYHKGALVGGLILSSVSLDIIPDQPRAALETIANQIGAAVAQAQVEDKLVQLSRVVEQSPASIVITDLNGLIEYINPKFTWLTGYTLEEAKGKRPSILKSGHTDQATYENLWQTILSGNEWQGEFLNVAKNGRQYWESALISPIKNSAGEITHFLAIKEDLTASKQMQKELEQRYRELQTLNRASQVINTSLNVREVLETVLEETRSVLNVTASSVWLLEKESSELVCWQATEPFGQYMNGWRVATGQGLVGWVGRHGESLMLGDMQADPRYYRGLYEQAGTRPRSLLAVPLLIRQEVIGVFQVVDEAGDRFTDHDLRIMQSLAAAAATAIDHARLHEDLKNQYESLKQAQIRLIQSEKLAAIGEIVAGVAHELNNPLAAVVLYSQLMLRKSITPEMERDLNEIVAQARRASSIVRGLLDFARQRPPERKKTLLNELVLSTLQLLAYDLRTHNVVCYTQLDADIPPALVDPHQLQQLFINLINNASQAMLKANQGGSLTIISQLRQRIPRPDSPPEQSVLIIFKDDGPGIPVSLHTRIFDPFFTTKDEGEGTGLGLSMCHGIVMEHGGDIWVESQPGQGATFFVELPLVLVEPTAVSPRLPTGQSELPAAPSPSAIRILVIDDEPSLIQVMTRLLSRQNYRVETAFSGDEGLQKLQKAQYDLIVCDLRMPGMSGIELYQHLLLRFPALSRRVIFTTGDMINASTLDFFQKHDLTYLAKPFEMGDLLNLVTSMAERIQEEALEPNSLPAAPARPGLPDQPPNLH